MSGLSFSVTTHCVKVLRGFSVSRTLGLTSCRNFASNSANYEPLGKEDRDRQRGRDRELDTEHGEDPQKQQQKVKSEQSAGGGGSGTDDPPPKKKESITERLMRMSMESAEDFVPQQRKPIDEYQSRFEYNPRDSRNREFDSSTRTQDSFRGDRHRESQSYRRDDHDRKQIDDFSNQKSHTNTNLPSYNNFDPTQIHPRRPNPQRPRPNKPTPIIPDDLDGSFRDDFRHNFQSTSAIASSELVRYNNSQEHEPNEPKQFRRLFKDISAKKHNQKPKTGSDFIVSDNDSIFHDDNPNYSESDDPSQSSQFGRKRIFESTSELDDYDSPEENQTEIITKAEAESDPSPRENDDPDTFGTLSAGAAPVIGEDSARIAHEMAKVSEEISIFAEEEADDYIFIPEDRWNDRKLRMKISELLREKKLTEALDIFLSALKDQSYYYDKYALSYMYALLIIECGKVGHVEMAFRLFRDYVKRGLTVKPQMFTYLLNACANSPWNAEENLKRIQKVRESMEKHAIPLNEIHYHTMIKAYGRCHDLQSAFSIVDEMMDSEHKKRIRPGQGTFAFLLQACVSETDNGFRHALVTWKKMNEMKIRPTIYCYNLLLRTIRECGIQIPSATIKLLKSSSSKTYSSDLYLSEGQSHRTIDPTEVYSGIVENSVVLELISLNDENPSPNHSYLKELMAHEDFSWVLTRPENRLALLGGIKGIIFQMQRDRVKPNIKTLTELLQVVPVIDIVDVLTLLETHKIKPDIHFFNLLIKKYMATKNLEKGRNVLELMSKYNMTPNIMTWGVLAIGCPSWTSAQSLLKEMDDAHMTPNKEILGAMLGNACDLYDPRYALRVMQEVVARDIKIDDIFFKRIDEFKSTTQQYLVNSETGKEVPDALKLAMKDIEFEEYWRKFKMRFDGYVQQTTKYNLEVAEVPWAEDYKMRKINLRKHELP